MARTPKDQEAIFKSFLEKEIEMANAVSSAFGMFLNEIRKLFPNAELYVDVAGTKSIYFTIYPEGEYIPLAKFRISDHPPSPTADKCWCVQSDINGGHGQHWKDAVAWVFFCRMGQKATEERGT